jgi:hypothetical protein
MKRRRKPRNVLFFVTRLGVAVGILICAFSAFVYLFVPQTAAVSLKLSSFGNIELPQNDNCAGAKGLVSKDYSILGMPPLEIVNRMTLMPEIRLRPQNHTFHSMLSLTNITVTVQSLVNGKATDLGQVKIDEEDLSGDVEGIEAHFDSSHPPLTYAYYCASPLFIPGDFAGFPFSAEVAIIEYVLEPDTWATVEIKGNLDLRSLGLQASSNDLLFILQSSKDELDSSRFTIYADGIDQTSRLLYGISSKELGYSLPKLELSAHANQISISDPVGQLQMGDDSIDLTSLTPNPQRKLVLASSVFKPDSSFFTIAADSNSKELKIAGEASSVIVNGQERVKVAWNTLPDYVQTGLFGLVIAALAAMLSRGNKLFAFFVPPKHEPEFLAGELVCETRSGYVIAGKLKRSPAKGFPYYEIENARRKLRTAASWEDPAIPNLRISAADVEQCYEPNPQAQKK